MTNPDWQVVVNERTHLVIQPETGKVLGGFGANYYRPWVFPLYSPDGRTVVQEFAFDHPFHNGVFVGQNPVLVGERSVNFWAAPPRRSATDALYARIGRMDAQGAPTARPIAGGIAFHLPVIWRDEAEAPVLDEVREVALYAVDDATICEMRSARTAAYGEIRLPQTKFGSIGIRVEPRLLPVAGGEVIADAGRRGSADVAHEGESTFISYVNEREPGFGVLMTLGEGGPRGPWFLRDYGMALYNPTWRDEETIPEGETRRLQLRVVAFDGALDDERALRWVRLPWQLPE